MRYITILLILGTILLTGCTTRADVSDTTRVAAILDGKLVRDKDGCVYTVTRESGIGNDLLLRNVEELNASTCTTWKSKRDVGS